MRTGRAALLAGAAGLGLALLALSVFHMTTVGTCGSSPRYGTLGGPCPSNTGEWIGALVGGVLIAIVVTGVSGLLAGPAFALALGCACIAALATGAAHSSWVIAAIVLALIFTPIGLVGLWRARTSLGARTAALLPLAAIGAAAGAAIAVAIPGPIREPKHVSFAQAEKVSSQSSQSWYRPARFRSALQTVTTKLGSGALITSISLKPGVAVLEAVSGSTSHAFSLRYGGGFDDFTSPANSDLKSVHVTTIDATAPQRLLAQLRSRFGIASSRVDEIDFQIGVVTGVPEWDAHLGSTDVLKYYAGDAHGLHVKAPTT